MNNVSHNSQNSLGTTPAETFVNEDNRNKFKMNNGTAPEPIADTSNGEKADGAKGDEDEPSKKKLKFENNFVESSNSEGNVIPPLASVNEVMLIDNVDDTEKSASEPAETEPELVDDEEQKANEQKETALSTPDAFVGESSARKLDDDNIAIMVDEDGFNNGAAPIKSVNEQATEEAEKEPDPDANALVNKCSEENFLRVVKESASKILHAIEENPDFVTDQFADEDNFYVVKEPVKKILEKVTRHEEKMSDGRKAKKCFTDIKIHEALTIWENRRMLDGKIGERRRNVAKLSVSMTEENLAILRKILDLEEKLFSEKEEDAQRDKWFNTLRFNLNTIQKQLSLIKGTSDIKEIIPVIIDNWTIVNQRVENMENSINKLKKINAARLESTTLARAKVLEIEAYFASEKEATIAGKIIDETNKRKAEDMFCKLVENAKKSGDMEPVYGIPKASEAEAAADPEKVDDSEEKTIQELKEAAWNLRKTADRLNGEYVLYKHRFPEVQTTARNIWREICGIEEILKTDQNVTNRAKMSKLKNVVAEDIDGFEDCMKASELNRMMRKIERHREKCLKKTRLTEKNVAIVKKNWDLLEIYIPKEKKSLWKIEPLYDDFEQYLDKIEEQCIKLRKKNIEQRIFVIVQNSVFIKRIIAKSAKKILKKSKEVVSNLEPEFPKTKLNFLMIERYFAAEKQASAAGKIVDAQIKEAAEYFWKAVKFSKENSDNEEPEEEADEGEEEEEDEEEEEVGEVGEEEEGEEEEEEDEEEEEEEEVGEVGEVEEEEEEEEVGEVGEVEEEEKEEEVGEVREVEEEEKEEEVEEEEEEEHKKEEIDDDINPHQFPVDDKPKMVEPLKNTEKGDSVMLTKTFVSILKATAASERSFAKMQEFITQREKGLVKRWKEISELNENVAIYRATIDRNATVEKEIIEKCWTKIHADIRKEEKFIEEAKRSFKESGDFAIFKESGDFDKNTNSLIEKYLAAQAEKVDAGETSDEPPAKKMRPLAKPKPGTKSRSSSPTTPRRLILSGRRRKMASSRPEESGNSTIATVADDNETMEVVGGKSTIDTPSV